MCRAGVGGWWLVDGWLVWGGGLGLPTRDRSSPFIGVLRGKRSQTYSPNAILRGWAEGVLDIFKRPCLHTSCMGVQGNRSALDLGM